MLPDFPVSYPRIWRALNALGSLKLTLVVLIVLAAGVIVTYESTVRTAWAVAAPLFAVALNLAAAVATRPGFRRQTALLVFHLALIAIILLLAIGRLTYLEGQVELAEGEMFDGQLMQEESGPWHLRQRLNKVQFSNEGFTISYTTSVKGLQRGPTQNWVGWITADGQAQRTVIGDQTPLTLESYRFYTTHNKGFAPVFRWHPADGSQDQIGAVHLPPYPKFEYKQVNEWQPPGSRTILWIMLQFDEVILDPNQPSEFRLPTEHKLVIRIGEQRHELRPGDVLRLPEGVLEYRELRKWMGYKVSYDFTLPWLLAACIVAALSMAVHFWRKFAARPWDQAAP
ncbi:MAG: cytochrome c biogenesis protein ResB [Gallionellaceae bacterium]|nr:cytochrome c biogenesis protein ResB [Gallionellaceae bacterium]